MRKTLNRDSKELLTVSAETLAGMLDCGRATAVKIGTDAGAKIQIGRRSLYKISAIEKYLNSLSSEENRQNEQA
ncbi:MAG: hypothetical protein K2P39_07305 [Lachnospiraceae bacterium]|nr:hypothetical protein [Lachnospiraceae bacterium]